MFLYDVNLNERHSILMQPKKVASQYLSRDVSWHPKLPLIMASSFDNSVVGYDYCSTPRNDEKEDGFEFDL